MPPSTGDSRSAHAQRLAARRAALAAALAPTLASGRSIVLEIGCGHGHFLAAFAAAHPTLTCIGIDIASDRIARATRKRDRARLDNLHFLRAEAALFLDVLPADTKLADVYILFPDPWPKLRHHKHRLLQAAFLSRLHDRMGPAARLFFRTDYEPYFLETRATIAVDSQWHLFDAPWPFEHETVFQSRAAQYHSLMARPASVRA